MFKGIKTTVLVVALATFVTSAFMIGCGNGHEHGPDCNHSCDSTNVGHFDSISSDTVCVDIADMTITVADGTVTITE